MKLSAASASVTAPNVGLATTAEGIVSAAAPRPTRFSRLRRCKTSSLRSSLVHLGGVVAHGFVELHANLLCLVASNDQRDRNTVAKRVQNYHYRMMKSKTPGPGRAHLAIRQANVALTSTHVWLIEISYD